MISKKEVDSEIPEGKEVIGSKLLCDKHGDVTQAVLRIPYSVLKPNETQQTVYEHYFCIQCLAELFESLQQEGKIGKLSLQRYVADPETAKAYREKQKEEMEKAAAAMEAEKNKEE